MVDDDRPRCACRWNCGYLVEAEGRHVSGHSPNAHTQPRMCSCGCGMPTQGQLNPYYRDHRSAKQSKPVVVHIDPEPVPAPPPAPPPPPPPPPPPRMVATRRKSMAWLQPEDRIPGGAPAAPRVAPSVVITQQPMNPPPGSLLERMQEVMRARMRETQ